MGPLSLYNPDVDHRRTTHELKERIRQAGHAAGFARVGFASAQPLSRQAQLQRWVDAGMAGEMAFIGRTAAFRHLPAHLLPGARTAVVVAASYASQGPRHPHRPGHGRVARYAQGPDYHHVLRQRLEHLKAQVRILAGHEVGARIAVDTSPLLERELGAAAGIGFVGKNTMLITPGLGSYTALGVLLIDLELPPDPRDAVRRCGRCELCLDACPTAALRQPYMLDARRCVSYLTIEHRGPVDASLGRAISPWVFGCDACQEACPYNARAGRSPADPGLEPASPDAASLALGELLQLRSGQYRRLVRGRVLARAPRRVLIRNAALVAGAMLRTAGEYRSLVGLLETLGDHADPAVSQAARWALGAGAHPADEE